MTRNIVKLGHWTEAALWRARHHTGCPFARRNAHRQLLAHCKRMQANERRGTLRFVALATDISRMTEAVAIMDRHCEAWGAP